MFDFLRSTRKPGKTHPPRHARLCLESLERREVPAALSLEVTYNDGKVVTLLDISKAQGNHLLDRLEELLRERATPKAILRKKKPTFARPAPDALRKEIVGATDVLVEALAD